MTTEAIAGRLPDLRFDAPAGGDGLDLALRIQAERCRRLARCIDDRQTRNVLDAMADEYEAAAGGPHG